MEENQLTEKQAAKLAAKQARDEVAKQRYEQMAENAKARAEQEATFSQRVQAFTGSRIKLFWVLFRSRLGLLAKTNMMLMLFAMPMIAMLFVFIMQRNGIWSVQPHSAPWFGGYPVILDAAYAARFNMFMRDFWAIISVTAGIPIFMIGFCGAMYTMKFLARGQNVKVINTFFVGIKKCVLPFLIISPLVSGLFFVLAAGGIGFDFYMIGQDGAKITILVFAGIFSLLLLFILFFYTTMSVTYKMNPLQILVNSLKIAFTPKLLWRHLVITLLCAAPITGAIFLIRVGSFGFIIGLILLMILLLGIMMLIWTVYADWVYKNVVSPTVAKRKTTVNADGETQENLEVTFNADDSLDASPDTDRPVSTEINSSDVEEVEQSDDNDDNADTADTTEQPVKKEPSKAPNQNKKSNAYKFKKK